MGAGIRVRKNEKGELEMKKLFAWLMVLMLAFSMVTAMAEAVEEGEEIQEEATSSEFEQVLLKKGTLLKKEFIDCCLFQEDSYYSDDTYQVLSDTLNLQSASLTDIETGSKIYALRVTGYYYNSQYDNGEAVGVMDADEIDGAISTLAYIKDHIAELKDYSEIEYSVNGGMSIGAYHSDSDEQIFIKINSKATKFYDVSTIDELIAAFTQVRDTFSEA